MYSKNIFLLGVFTALSACAMQPERSPEQQQEIVQAEEAKLDEIVEAFFEDSLEMTPLTATFLGDNRFNDRLAISISPQFQAEFKALEQKYLASVQQLDENLLTGQARLTYDVFIYNRELSLEGYQYIPSFWGPKPSAGMHGHHPRYPSQHGVCLSNRDGDFEGEVRAGDFYRVLADALSA